MFKFLSIAQCTLLSWCTKIYNFQNLFSTYSWQRNKKTLGSFRGYVKSTLFYWEQDKRIFVRCHKR